MPINQEAKPHKSFKSIIHRNIKKSLKDPMTGRRMEAFKTNFTSQHRIGGKVPVSKILF